jgi:hypothetical protein
VEKEMNYRFNGTTVEGHDPLVIAHRAIARLDQLDADGWIDLFDAVTKYAESGRAAQAVNLLNAGLERVSDFTGQDDLRAELDRLRKWADTVCPR